MIRGIRDSGRARGLRVLVGSPGRSGMPFDELATTKTYKANFTLPSVILRSVSTSSNHFSMPSRCLISSSHPIACSTRA